MIKVEESRQNSSIEPDSCSFEMEKNMRKGFSVFCLILAVFGLVMIGVVCVFIPPNIDQEVVINRSVGTFTVVGVRLNHEIGVWELDVAPAGGNKEDFRTVFYPLANPARNQQEALIGYNVRVGDEATIVARTVAGRGIALFAKSVIRKE